MSSAADLAASLQKVRVTEEQDPKGVDIKTPRVTADVGPTPNNTPIFTNVPPKSGSEDQKKAMDLNQLKNQLAGLPSFQTDSELLAKLPGPVKKRVQALQNLQDKQYALDLELHEEVLALEKKYLEKQRPLHERRALIVSGSVEPTDEEAQRPAEEDVPESKIEEIDAEKPAAPADIKGVPNFWLTVLKNHPDLSAEIYEADEEILSSLTDIKLFYHDDNPGFKLEFHFAPNAFFSNAVLTKKYYLDKPSNPYEDTIFDRAEGTEIQWKSQEKNVTVRVEVKKQRHRGTKKTRTVKKTVPADSFFHFFSPPTIPEDKEDDDEEGDDEQVQIEEKIQMDFTLGDLIRTKIVPNAVDWFTGKALEYEDDDYEFDEGEEGDDEDYEEQEDDDEDEGEDDDDDNDAPPAGSGRGARGRGARGGRGGRGQEQKCQQQ